MSTRRSSTRLAILLVLVAMISFVGGLTLAQGRGDAVPLAVPDPPENVEASHDQADHIEVTWDAVAGATGYQVLRAANEYGTYTLVSQDAVTEPLWRDLWALSGQGYWYKVRACSLAGCGTRSEAASGYRNGPPLPPVNLVASDGVTTDTVTLDWDLSVGAIDYEILRNTTDDPDAAWALGRMSSPPYEDKPPLPDTTYWYWVTARSAKGDSRFSEPDRGYCGDEPPDWEITPTPTSTPTLYATATDAPVITDTPAATPSRTATSGLVTATPGGVSPTVTETRAPATLTPTATRQITRSFSILLPFVRE